MTSHNYDPNNSETPKLTKPQILDARKDETDNNGVASTKSQIFDGLSKPDGEKRLPTMLLYDEQGLKLYDDITTKCHEYYLFLAEEQIVKNHAEDIVSLMHKGTTGQAWKGRSAVVELGAGWVLSLFRVTFGTFAHNIDSFLPVIFNSDTSTEQCPQKDVTYSSRTFQVCRFSYTR